MPSTTGINWVHAMCHSLLKACKALSERSSICIGAVMHGVLCTDLELLPAGLDARAAAIVMRSVRAAVDTGRTVVATIHQPSIDIFESFDDLLLMKACTPACACPMPAASQTAAHLILLVANAYTAVILLALGAHI